MTQAPESFKAGGGVMVALIPPLDVAEALALDGGLAVDDLHLTLCYIGKIDALDDLAVARLVLVVDSVARSWNPVSGKVSGVGRFITGDPEGDAFVALVDSLDLGALRDRLLGDAIMYDAPQPEIRHGFTPHITLAYLAPDAPSPMDRIDPLQVQFSSLILQLGDKRMTFPFASGVTTEPERVFAKERGMLARVWAAFKTLFDHEYRMGTDAPPVDKDKPTGFRVYKDKTGAYRWFGWVSNKWRDRDDEIIEDGAHREYVDYLDRTQDFPELLTWHTKGTRYGVTDWADYADGFVVMSGPIDDNPTAIGAAMRLEGKDLGMSHGFINAYSDKSKGIIGWYRDVEVSSLPPAAAANVWTQIGVSQEEVGMGFRADKRAHLVDVWGEDRVAVLERDTKQRKDALEAAGIDFKEVWEDEGSTALTEKQIGEIGAAAAKALAESPAIKAIGDNMATLGQNVDQLTAAAKATDERLTALERTDDQKVADAFKARTTPGIIGQRASESAGNILTDAEKELAAAGPNNKETDWLRQAL